MKKNSIIITFLLAISSFTLPITKTNNNMNKSYSLKQNFQTTNDLNNLILNKNLFTIKTGGLIKPTVNQILTVTKELNLNPVINWNKISVDENSITTTGATLISLDSNIYTGKVNVTYNLDISAQLKDVITTTDLKILNLDGWKSKSALKDIILNQVKKLNPQALDWSKISIDENSITWAGAELISTDTTVYSGVVAISFKTNVYDNLNLYYSKSYDGTSSSDDYTSPTKIIFSDWNSYADNWADFTGVCPTLNFNSDSYITVQTVDGTSSVKKFSLNLSYLSTTVYNFFICNRDDTKFLRTAQISLAINIWHDYHNIYLDTQIYESASLGSDGLFATANITTINFPLVDTK